MSKVYVVIRTIGESTLKECINSVTKRGFSCSTVKDYRPLEKAAKETIRLGSLMLDYDWIMALDADVILTASRNEIERHCYYMERKYKKIFAFTVHAEDTKRGIIPAVHFYKQQHCHRAYLYLKDTKFGNYRIHKAESEMVHYLHLYKGLQKVLDERDRQLIIGKHIWEENNK